ncbi:hypothetical protein PoB_006968700 [Plakobranchus ocellatus]|uniref:Uncharacterized protein n=1 Tax=Plakobranchus ocellatus TaxID=259542 RepID=A0AAV4DG06_9GAST|nr:hypothetical protein PoB_006968700 [Plakobranchus ocellatus]
MEDRMPFCLLVFPPWFLRKYPDVDRALTLNQNRLTSHFDIHATLRHILYFDGGNRAKHLPTGGLKGGGKASNGILSDVGESSTGSQAKVNNLRLSHGEIPDPFAGEFDGFPEKSSSIPTAPARGMSVFREIPRDRSCRDAGIDFQWCSCNRLEPVEMQDGLIRLLAFEFALLLSDKTLRARHLCHQLNLGKIRSAMRVHLAQDLLSEEDGKEEEEGEGKEKATDKERETDAGKRQFSKILSAFQKTNVSSVKQDFQRKNDKSNGGDADNNNQEMSIYLLSIETKPGGAVFEGHLQFSHADSSVRLLGTVLRLNMFQPQSMCVEEPGLKPFCYCKDLDESKKP